MGKAGPAVLSPRSSFKEFVLGKYTSLASAFRHMDVDHSGIVKLSVSGTRMRVDTCISKNSKRRSLIRKR